MDERTLSEWGHDGGLSYRLRRDPYGNKIMAIVVSNSAGWSVEHPGGGESPRGSECGKAGRAAADRAAMELGWTLEGGPAAPPEYANRWRDALVEIARALAGLQEGDPPEAWGADLAAPDNVGMVVSIIKARTERVARLTTELAERTRERDFWSDEVRRLQDAAAERADDRLCGITERERALERAIVALALRMGERA